MIEKNNPVDQPNHHWGDGNQEDILTFADLRIPVTADELTSSTPSAATASGRVTARGSAGRGSATGTGPRSTRWGSCPPSTPTSSTSRRRGGVRGVAAGWLWDAGLTWGHNAFEYNLTNTLNVSLGPCLDTPCAPGLDGILGNADDPGIPNQTEFFAGELQPERGQRPASTWRANGTRGSSPRRSTSRSARPGATRTTRSSRARRRRSSRAAIRIAWAILRLPARRCSRASRCPSTRGAATSASTPTSRGA